MKCKSALVNVFVRFYQLKKTKCKVALAIRNAYAAGPFWASPSNKKKALNKSIYARRLVSPGGATNSRPSCISATKVYPNSLTVPLLGREYYLIEGEK